MAKDDHTGPSERREHRDFPAAADAPGHVEEQLRELLAGVESGQYTASAGLVNRLEGVLITLQHLQDR